jgi:hypothetical protein
MAREKNERTLNVLVAFDPCRFVDHRSNYEKGELDAESTLELFQALVDTGLAWQLQEHYKRDARGLFNEGLVRLPQQNESPRMMIRRLLDPDGKGPGVQQGGDGHENETKADKSPDPAIAPAQHAALRPKFAVVILCSFS